MSRTAGVSNPYLEPFLLATGVNPMSTALVNPGISKLSRFSLNASQAVRWIVGGLLLGAAMLKASGGDETVRWRSAALSEAIHFSAIQLELMLAAACFVEIAPRATKKILIVLFSSFTVYGVYLAISGANSCGCFGPLKVLPSWTITLDVAVIGLLLAWRPVQRQSGQLSARRRQWLLLLTIYAAVAVPASLWRVANRPKVLTKDSAVSTKDTLVVLEPESWKGRVLPIANYVDIGEQLMLGDWIVLLHQHGCSKCQETVPKYTELAALLAKRGSSTRVALIEIPPFASGETPGRLATTYLSGRISNAREWFVHTPVEITVRDGIVTHVHDDL